MKNWICTPKFADLEPLNVFSKESDRVDYDIDFSLADSHVLFRKSFTLDDLNGNFKIDITADDYYKLYVNGTFVGQGPAPSYYFNYNYNTYDISSCLKNGENVIAVHCYYQGLINRVWTSGDNRMGLCAAVYRDEKLLFETDTDWKYSYDESFTKGSEIIGYDTQFLENIDMREAQRGWKAIDFDDSAWGNAVVKTVDDHVLKAAPIASLCVYEIKPDNVKMLENGTFLYDFGKEIVGGLRVQAKGDEGNCVRLMCAEELNADGMPRYKLRCNLVYDEIWTFSGDSDVIENYDYKGFRYVLLKTNQPNFDTDSLTAVVRHYPLRQKFDFNCENETLKKIWDICENAVIISSQEGFLDCPTREKGQYLGDMTVTAVSHAYVSGDTSLYKKALYDFADTAYICKGLMAVSSCSLMQEIADFSLLYPVQLLKYYHLSGDIQTLAELSETVENMLFHFKQYERDDGLLASVKDKWNLVDWPVNLRDGYDFEMTKPIGEGCHAVINAYYYGALKAADEIRCILEKPKKYNCEKVKESFLKAFRDEKSGLITDSEKSTHSSLHSNALPLFFKMLDVNESKPIIDLIARKRLSCGVFFSYFVLKGLAQYERKDIAFELITADEPQSWANMLKEGATSCFEAWGKEQKANTSLCHPWASAPIILIMEDLLGVNFVNGKRK